MIKVDFASVALRKLADPLIAEIFVSKISEIYDKASANLATVLELSKDMQSTKDTHWWQKIDKPTDLACVINAGKECFADIDGDALEPAVAALEKARRDVCPKSRCVLDTRAHVFQALHFVLVVDDFVSQSACDK